MTRQPYRGSGEGAWSCQSLHLLPALPHCAPRNPSPRALFPPRNRNLAQTSSPLSSCELRLPMPTYIRDQKPGPRQFPGGPVGTARRCPCQWLGFDPGFGELNSHKPCHTARKTKQSLDSNPSFLYTQEFRCLDSPFFRRQ